MTTARNRRTRKQQQNRAEARKRRGTNLDLFDKSKLPKPKRQPKPKASAQGDGNDVRGSWADQADRAMVHGNGGGRRLLFVYGTLKDGYGLAGRLPYKRIPATVRGRVYDVSAHGGYPVLDIREDGWVAGEIVCVPSHAEGLGRLADTLKMEQGAGYTIRETQALLPNESTWRDVLVCAWEHPERGPRHLPTIGHRVDGDRTEDAAEWSPRPPRRLDPEPDFDWTDYGDDVPFEVCDYCGAGLIGSDGTVLDHDGGCPKVTGELDVPDDGYRPAYLAEEAEVTRGRSRKARR